MGKPNYGLGYHPRSFPTMAKSKNHTGHNQVYKNHRNGIKKTRRPRKQTTEGMNCKFIRNQAFAKRGMAVTGEDREARQKSQQEAQSKMEEKKDASKKNKLAEIAAEKDAAALKKAKGKK